MRRLSLRSRLVAGGALVVLVALAIAGLALALLFDRHASRAVADELDVHLRQLAAALTIEPSGHLGLGRAPADPRFAEPLSGLYWQADDGRGAPLRSRSLWDETLALPADRLAPAAAHRHVVAGPNRRDVLVSERLLVLADSGGDRRVRIAVAADRGRIDAARSAFAADLLIALGVLAAALGLGTWVQVGLGLRPLSDLARAVAAIRAGTAARLPATFPAEVAPLVTEVNALLALRAAEAERSRDRAADLAHGLKTPLAALAGDVRRLRDAGQAAVADEIEALGDAMRRHIDRELVRARVRPRPDAGDVAGTLVRPVAEAIARTLARTPAGADRRFLIDLPADATVGFGADDLAEVLGNLMENACRHARTTVRVAVPDGAGSLAVEDDGPGMPEAAAAQALRRGVRLDRGGDAGSAGLGLAIVRDVLDAYGWRMDFGASALGGLRVVLRRAPA